jgi:hypothetical protein
MKYLLVLAVLAAAAWFYFKPLPPGKGPDADHGKRVAGALIQTLESYRSARGLYPPDLDDLVPDYLSGVPVLGNGSSFSYTRLGANYKLSFNYSNPLPVHCIYEPTTHWSCEWF